MASCSMVCCQSTLTQHTIKLVWALTIIKWLCIAKLKLSLQSPFRRNLLEICTPVPKPFIWKLRAKINVQFKGIGYLINIDRPSKGRPVGFKKSCTTINNEQVPRKENRSRVLTISLNSPLQSLYILWIILLKTLPPIIE